MLISSPRVLFAPLLIAVASLISPLAVTVPAQAAAAPAGGFTVNCTDQTVFDTSVSAITWPGTSRVITALIDDTFVITNSGSSDCVFSSGTALDSDSTAIANGTPRTVTVANSGFFTLTPSGGVATTFYVDACSLPGSGIEADPWQVADRIDFQKVGRQSPSAGASSCSRAGHYKQTNNIELTNVSDRVPTFASDNAITNAFTGVYDGDFYRITLGGDPLISGSWTNHTLVEGIFGTHLAGTVKKLYLDGNYRTSSFWGSPLALNVLRGGLISQVHSAVDVTVTGNSDTIYLSGLVRTLGRGAIMEYSSASGALSWEPAAGSPTTYQYYGGLVGVAGSDLNQILRDNPRSTEIRDSYSRVTVSWPAAGKCYATFGGIVGLVPTSGGDVYVVRSYSASSISSASLDLGGAACTNPGALNFLGGLIGRSDLGRTLANPNSSVSPPLLAVPSYTYLVSSFWAKDLIGGASTSIGYQQGSPVNQTASNQYVGGLPRGVGLDSSLLKDIRTFESREGSTAGLPSNSSNLPIASSLGTKSTDGTLTTNAATYRWGIEPGNQEAFIPADYSDPQDFLTRTVFTDNSVSRSMAGKGSATLEGPVTNYPHLGRIWEICSSENGGFPVLVWEERDCGGAAGAAYAGVPTSDSLLGEAGSGGSSDAGSGGSSGVTGAQQPALAATGPNDSQSLFLLASSGILILLGGVALWVRRRTRKLYPLNPS